MKRLRIVSALGALVLLVVPAASAGDFGIIAGGTYADQDIDGSDNIVAPLVGLQAGVVMGERSRWAFDGTWSPLDVDGGNDWNLMTLRTGPEFFFSDTLFFAPAVGWMWLDEEKGENASRGLASLGLGQRFAGPGNNGFSWQVRATQGLGSSGLNGNSVTNFEALLGYAWGSGGAPPKDEDGDGVPDKKDKCPGTPAGATVDEKGCPKDSDGDGVLDGIDKCPDTPKGYPVDATGCPKDSDGDGVVDGVDKCPDTPKGYPVDANGCPLDSDGDGVLDGADKCPGTPAGTKVDATGCPLDSDGDGVPDSADKCPGTPKGTPVDATGCPPPKAEPGLAVAATLVLEGVNFETGKATLLPSSRTTLDKVASRLKEFPDVQVQVNGHTDNVGADSANLRLSEDRAKAVVDYLVAQGIPAGQLTSKGFGETRPVASNDTEEGRAQNRRVELERLK